MITKKDFIATLVEFMEDWDKRNIIYNDYAKKIGDPDRLLTNKEKEQAWFDYYCDKAERR